MKLASQKALVSTIVRAKRDISILVGSPLSMPDSKSAPGVPSVSGVLEILSSRIKDEGLESDYLEETKELSDAEGYQAGFQFLRDWVGQDAVNEVVKTAVLKSRTPDSLQSEDLEEIEKDQNGWYLPSGTEALGKIIANHKHLNGPVLTTNFDPLVSKAIIKAGCNPLQSVLDSDGSFNQHRVNDPKNRQVVHLHGYWHKSDTLHTPDQLTARRPNLKASLSDLLSTKILLVVGYGGWDDIFIDALTSLMSDNNSSLEVLWAFFEKDLDIVNKRYRKLLDSVEPARTRGRFKLYGGIDCNKFFNELLTELNQRSGYTDKPPETPALTNEPVEQLLFGGEQAFAIADTPLSKESLTEFKKQSIHTTASHQAIRTVEQLQFLDALNKDRIVNVVADWGMDTKSFIHAALKYESSPYFEADLYRIDLDNVTDRDGFLSCALEQLGAEIQEFITSISKQKEKIVLLLDGVVVKTEKSPHTEFHKILSQLTSAFLDFVPNLQIIFTSIKEIEGVKCNQVYLSPLDDADINSYIKSHKYSSDGSIGGTDFEAVSRLSGGIPTRLDRILSQLRVVSVEDLIEYDTDSSFDSDGSESVPAALKRAIYELENSQADQQKRSYYLLQVLSVLSYGENLSNIRRFDHKKPFYPANLVELSEIGLVETVTYSRSLPDISQSNTAQKLQTVSPLVAEYVLSQLNDEQIYKIALRASELTFGPDWRNNKIKFSSSALEHIKKPIKSGPGNPHLLAKKMLRASIEQGIAREINQAFNISLIYCSKLLEHDRYRDIVTVASEILLLAKETSEIEKITELDLILGRALRMAGLNDKALEVLERAFSNIDDLPKSEKSAVCLNLALHHEFLGNKSAALEAADNVQIYSPKESPDYLQAESIKISSSKSADSSQRLFKLEKQARGKNAIIVANNISLELADITDDTENQIKLYDKVIDTKTDSYNISRAIIKKAGLLIKMNQEERVDSHERVQLNQSYKHFYMQRMNGLFNSAHDALWFLYEKENDHSGLANLFRYSSLIWRLQGDEDKERRYAEKLSRIIEGSHNVGPRKNLISYALVRIRFLIQEKVMS